MSVTGCAAVVSSVHCAVVADWLCCFCRQERHLAVAVTQLLAFLYPARASTWSPSEAVLVYQHLIVLQTLTTHLPDTLAFIQRQFTEEFR